MMRRYKNERGDTLIEVTIALAILAVVLTGAFVTANRAFRLGQDAKERSQMVGYAQQQAEALSSFRDAHTWNTFVAGGAGVNGVNIRATGPTCTESCFHMQLATVSGQSQWVPIAGPSADGGLLGGQGYLYITVVNNALLPGNPAAYDFNIHYGVPHAGGGPDLTNDIRLRLADLDSLR